MRLKTNRRLILLAVSLVVLAAGAFALYFVRGWQKTRMADEFFASGQEAFKAHRYYPALTNTAQFLNRVKSSPVQRANPRYAQALLTYAESRRLIEENDDRNLREAIPFYIQYHDLRPDDTAARLTLLQSYNRARLFIEARDLALKSLPSDLSQAKAEDVAALRELTTALRGLAKNEPAEPRFVAAVDRLLALVPLDFQANLLRLENDANSGRKKEARARADQLLKDHPDEPAALMVAAFAREIDPRGDDLRERHKFLCRAAGLDPNTAARVRPAASSDELLILQLALAFDAGRAFEFSSAVLEDAADRLKSPVIERLLVRRLWQENKSDKVLARTADLDPSNPESHAELLGFRALCLQRTGKSEEAAKIAAALSAREGDFRAGGWGAAIPLIDATSRPPPAEAAAAWKTIVSPKGNPGEPVFHVYHGEALAAAGRLDEARAAWQDARAIPVAASWFLPALRIAESLLAEGRAGEAVKAADDARAMAPDRAVVAVTWFEAQAARIQTGAAGGPEAAAILAELEQALPKLTEVATGDSGRELTDRLLAPHVLLLARSNLADDAKAVAMDAIRREPAPAPETLQRLAAVSASEHLGFEGDAMRRVEATAGETVSVLFVKATDLAAAGKPDQGLALFRDAAQKKPGDLQLQMGLARYLERIGKPEATAAWVAIGDSAPEDLSVQKACLQAQAAAGDARFIERTVQRYTKLSGSTPAIGDPLTSIALARAAMWGRPSKADRERAVGLLAAAVGAQPGLVEPKKLLAATLSYSDLSRDIRPDFARAASQLADAVAIEPRNAPLALDLGRALQQDRQFERAREVLSPLASDVAGDPATRRSACELLINQGEPGPLASRVLAELVANAGDQAPASLLVVLAEAYRAQREDARADAIYTRLASGAATDADSIYMTARYYTLGSDSAKAAAVIGKLDTLKLEPGIKEYALARLAADTDDASLAATRYDAAVAAAPARADIWRQYVQFLLRTGSYADAQRIAERAVKAVPDDTSLSALLEQARMFGSGAGKQEIQTLIRAMAADPAQAEAAEALRALDAAATKGDAESPESLVSIADKYSTCVPIQLYVARGLARIAPERAVIVARRAMSISPSDPAPAKSAAEIYMGLGRWSDMLAAALEWQRRDTSRPLEADLAIAQAYLRLGQFDKGLSVLTPRAAKAQASPTAANALGVLNVQARLLLGSGKDTDARALLAPLLPSSAVCRIGVWLAIAIESTPDLPSARAWIAQLLPVIPADAADERIAVASGYMNLAARFRDSADELLGQGALLLEDLTKNPKTATAASWESLGMILHSRSDLAGAQAAYRKAIALDPKRPISLNNLAGILAESPGKLDEAMALAKAAVDLDPLPGNLDTLAAIYAAVAHEQQGKSDATGAAQSFRTAADLLRRAAQADRGNPRPLMGAAQMFENARDPVQAAACYEALLKYQGLTAETVAAAKNNLAMSLVRLNRSKSDLDRAVALATEATQVSDLPAFLDTLGWCQLADGLPEDAQASFRQALDRAAAKKQSLVSATIGLATILARGPADQKAQARHLLEGIDPKKLEAEDAARYQNARSLLEKAP